MPKTKLTKDEALHIIAKISADDANSELLIDCYHDMLFNQMNEDLSEKEIFSLAKDMGIPLYQ